MTAARATTAREYAWKPEDLLFAIEERRAQGWIETVPLWEQARGMKDWLAVLVALVACPAFAGEKPAPPSALLAAAEKLRPLMQKKTPPKPGDWLAEHREDGQTFDQYVASNPNRPTAERTTLYILPIGDFTKAQDALVKDTAEAMAAFFGLKVKTLEPLPDAAIPARARRTHPSWGVKQFHTAYILDELLLKLRPRDAVALLGLTATDLFPEPSWNFVFGQASLQNRVGVWSLARYGDAEKDHLAVLRRTLKVALHETGHMFGIAHCTLHECGMNGANNLPETDRGPMPFCAECDLKLWWACNLDPVTRYGALADFAKKRGLTSEEAEWRKRAEALVKK